VFKLQCARYEAFLQDRLAPLCCAALCGIIPEACVHNFFLLLESEVCMPIGVCMCQVLDLLGSSHRTPEAGAASAQAPVQPRGQEPSLLPDLLDVTDSLHQHAAAAAAAAGVGTGPVDSTRSVVDFLGGLSENGAGAVGAPEAGGGDASLFEGLAVSGHEQQQGPAAGPGQHAAPAPFHRQIHLPIWATLCQQY